MTPGRIQDPEGAKTVVVSFKTAAGAILAVQRQTFKIVCFKDTDNGRLRVDTTTTIEGKQDSAKHGRRVILIYKSHMYIESSLDPERCSHKTDEKARRAWLLSHIRQIEQYEDINSVAGEQQEDDIMEEEDTDPGLPDGTEIPPSGSGTHIHTGAVHQQRRQQELRQRGSYHQWSLTSALAHQTRRLFLSEMEVESAQGLPLLNCTTDLHPLDSKEPTQGNKAV